MRLNTHASLMHRLVEEDRLVKLSRTTLSKYGHYQQPQTYLSVLREMDIFCNDGIDSTQCNVGLGCKCVACTYQNEQ